MYCIIDKGLLFTVFLHVIPLLSPEKDLESFSNHTSRQQIHCHSTKPVEDYFNQNIDPATRFN